MLRTLAALTAMVMFLACCHVQVMAQQPNAEGTVGTLPLANDGLVQSPLATTSSPSSWTTDSGSISMTASPGDGLTISMLNGTSKLKLFANISAIGIFSTDRPFSPGLPLFLLPASPFGLTTNTFDFHARQSNIGAIFTGPEFCGLTPGATFLAFIANDSLVADNYGLLPYNAYGELKNDDWRFAAGLQNDVFNPRKPTIISLASLFGSGNTGSFRGQARLERFVSKSDDLAITLQGALSEPIQSVLTDRNTRIVEDNGWPNIEGRAALGIGLVADRMGGRALRPVEVGVSGIVGQIRSSRSLLAAVEDRRPTRSVVDVWGLGVDAQFAMTDRFGLAGELFMGEGLGEYNGGIQQTFNTATLQGIRARGGWGEVYCYFTEKLHLHTGYGIDAPIARDLAQTQILCNQTAFANLVCDVSKTFQVSFEVDYRKTNYIQFLDADGVLFYTQFLWRF
jgi:hypothetical protein